MSNIIKEEIDLERFVELFDTAMNSENPAVQKCFNNLMLVVALVHAEDKTPSIGPLRKLVTEVRELQQRVYRIESETHAKRNPYIHDHTWTTTGHGYVPPFSGASSTYTFK
jgi:hypothetical protein